MVWNKPSYRISDFRQHRDTHGYGGEDPQQQELRRFHRQPGELQPPVPTNTPPLPTLMDMGTHSGAAISGNNGSLPTMHSFDIQQFDESASVDLQQLFPNSTTTQQHIVSMQEAAPLSHLTSAIPIHHQSQHLPPTMPPFYPQHPHAMPLDYFGESLSNYQSETSHTMAPPFPQHAAYEEAAELAEVFTIRDGNGGTSISTTMTPPTSMLPSRTSAVSPIRGGSAKGSFLTPMSTNTSGGVSRMSVETVTVDTHPKFSPDRRKLCCIEGCKSQARAFNRCKRHGGSKRCSHPGCTKSVQSRGLCIRHGGGSRCQEIGCTRAAQSHGRCKMHGGGRPCIVEGCDKKAHLKRLCRKHGGGAKCSLIGCDKWAQRQGMCMTHSKHLNPIGSSSSSAVAAVSTAPTIVMTTRAMKMPSFGHDVSNTDGPI